MTTHVFFYVQHLLGIGHLARASRIARAMVAEGLRVTLVTGGMPVAGFPGPGIHHIALPPVAASSIAFAGLSDEHGVPVDQAFLDRRRDLLIAAFHAAKPDIVMTEAFPFGRKQVKFELLPLIAEIEATTPRPRLVASIRDILQARAKPERDAETAAVVRAHYNAVLVHGDPAFAALGESFPLADQIADKVIYTGLVCPEPAPLPDERFDIVVSAGGGAVGAGMVAAAGAAAHLLPDLGRWCLITGPNLAQANFDSLAATLPPHVQLERFRTDFASLLRGARLSVSQAGYNTVGDILQAGCRALLIPFAKLGETEQADRARRLAALGRATVLEDEALTPETLADAIRAALALPEPAALAAIKTDGASETARILRRL